MKYRFFSILIVSILFQTNLLAQYDGLRITLWKGSLVVDKTEKICAYCNPVDSSYYVAIKKQPRFPDDWMSENHDTVYEIAKNEFNRLAELCLGLSSLNILGGIDASAVFFGNEFGSSLLLDLMINGQSVSYRINSPFDKNNRHFKQFGEVCEAIILLAKEDPDEFLERKTKKKKWYKK